MPQFVTEVPEVEIVDGLVHTKLGGQEWYWKPSTFHAFIKLGRYELAEFDSAQRGALPFRKRA